MHIYVENICSFICIATEYSWFYIVRGNKRNSVSKLKGNETAWIETLEKVNRMFKECDGWCCQHRIFL